MLLQFEQTKDGRKTRKEMEKRTNFIFLNDQSKLSSLKQVNFIHICLIKIN